MRTPPLEEVYQFNFVNFSCFILLRQSTYGYQIYFTAHKGSQSLISFFFFFRFKKGCVIKHHTL